MSKVAADIPRALWVALFRMLAPADGPNAPQPGEAGPTCDGIVFSLANRKKGRKKKKKARMRKERDEKNTQTFTYLHCLPRISNSPVARPLAGSLLLFVCLLVLNRLW